MPKPELIATENMSPSVREAIQSAPLPGLDDGPKCSATFSLIEGLLSERPSPLEIKSPSAVAGLWLLAGELDRSHEISQTIDNATGSYWHAIMHRREGDFSNAKYWLRRASGHPVMQELADQISSVAGSDTIAYLSQKTVLALEGRILTESVQAATGLVDLCELAVASNPTLTLDLQLIFWWEWQLLFRYSAKN